MQNTIDITQVPIMNQHLQLFEATILARSIRRISFTIYFVLLTQL